MKTFEIHPDQKFKVIGPRWATFLTVDGVDWSERVGEQAMFQVHGDMAPSRCLIATVASVMKSRFTKDRWRVTLMRDTANRHRLGPTVTGRCDPTPKMYTPQNTLDFRVDMRRDLDTMRSFADATNDYMVPGKLSIDVSFRIDLSGNRTYPRCGERIWVEGFRLGARKARVVRVKHAGHYAHVDAQVDVDNLAKVSDGENFWKHANTPVKYTATQAARELSMLRGEISATTIAQDLINTFCPDFHPNCRCVAVPLTGERTMAPKNTKIPKFYVASTAISRSLVPGGVDDAGRILRPANLTADYVKHTEKEAVEMARSLVEKDGEARYIVKIIKVVRRKPQPIVVEGV